MFKIKTHKSFFVFVAIFFISEFSIAGTPEERFEQLKYVEQSSDTSKGEIGDVVDKIHKR